MHPHVPAAPVHSIYHFFFFLSFSFPLFVLWTVLCWIREARSISYPQYIGVFESRALKITFSNTDHYAPLLTHTCTRGLHTPAATALPTQLATFVRVCVCLCCTTTHTHTRSCGRRQWREIVAVTQSHTTNENWTIYHLFLFCPRRQYFNRQSASQPANSNEPNERCMCCVYSPERIKPAFRCFSTAHSAHCVNQCELCSRTKWCRSFEQSPNSLKRLLCVYYFFFSFVVVFNSILNSLCNIDFSIAFNATVLCNSWMWFFRCCEAYWITSFGINFVRFIFRFIFRVELEFFATGGQHHEAELRSNHFFNDKKKQQQQNKAQCSGCPQLTPDRFLQATDNFRFFFFAFVSKIPFWLDSIGLFSLTLICVIECELKRRI